MKKMPDRLKNDRRKTFLNKLKDNGFEVEQENKTENSAYASIKRRSIKMLERKITETTDQAEIEKMKLEIEKKEQQIENYLNK